MSVIKQRFWTFISPPKVTQLNFFLFQDKAELITLQTRLLAEAQSDVRSNLITVFGNPEQITTVGEEQLLDALDSKYDTLRDKLLSEALMKEMGAAEWQALSEQERQAKLVKMKLEERRLRREGKMNCSIKVLLLRHTSV